MQTYPKAGWRGTSSFLHSHRQDSDARAANRPSCRSRHSHESPHSARKYWKRTRICHMFDVKPMQDMLFEHRWPFRVFGTVFTVSAVICGWTFVARDLRVMAYSSSRARRNRVRMARGRLRGVPCALSWAGTNNLAIAWLWLVRLRLTRVLTRAGSDFTQPIRLTFAAISMLAGRDRRDRLLVAGPQIDQSDHDRAAGRVVFGQSRT